MKQNPLKNFTPSHKKDCIMKNQKTQKQIKTVQVIARIEFKSDSRKVVYQVRSSNGADIYHTSLFEGRACSCTCPSYKPCYHMVQLEALEAAHREAKETARINREMAFSA
jgi:hypothetical protein